jgi:hypothetical protein
MLRQVATYLQDLYPQPIPLLRSDGYNENIRVRTRVDHPVRVIEAENRFYFKIEHDEDAVHIARAGANISLQLVSFQSLRVPWGKLTEPMQRQVRSCPHADGEPCFHGIPYSLMLDDAVYWHRDYMFSIMDVEKMWLKNAKLAVLTCLFSTSPGPMTRLLEHPLYDKNIWYAVFAAAWPRFSSYALYGDYSKVHDVFQLRDATYERDICLYLLTKPAGYCHGK